MLLDFSQIETQERIYIFASAAFYLFSIYQNILVCVRFYSNMQKIHNYLFQIKKYLEYYKDNKVYVFSPKLDDPAFKKIKNLHYVKLDDSLVKDPLDVSEFKDSICLFDDIESITDKRLNNAVRVFRDQCYEIGRAPTNITTIAVHHVILANDRTKIILNELTMYICWKKNLKKNRILTEYYGIDESYLKNINTKSWCLFNFKYSKVITPREIKDFETNQD